MTDENKTMDATEAAMVLLSLRSAFAFWQPKAAEAIGVILTMIDTTTAKNKELSETVENLEVSVELLRQLRTQIDGERKDAVVDLRVELTKKEIYVDELLKLFRVPFHVFVEAVLRRYTYNFKQVVEVLEVNEHVVHQWLMERLVPNEETQKAVIHRYLKRAYDDL